MKLSQSASYAVNATVRLAEQGSRTPLSCGKLADEGQMPERFLLQILRDLAKKGILHSARGGSGGFTLDRDPKEITLLDLVEAIDGPLTPSIPPMNTLPLDSAEMLRNAMRTITESTRRQLAAITLSDLVRARSAKGQLQTAILSDQSQSSLMAADL